MALAVLPADCPGCGSPRPASVAAVCEVCGTPSEPAQRRLVTILFADLTGYTALCQSRDPEDVHLLIRPLMNSLRRVCEDYGGVVPSIEGDGFMAAFGARLATENDPAQAVWAAVQLQRIVSERRQLVADFPALRVAVHAGEVVVAPSWESSGFSLSGDVVNVASRLSGSARSGEVLVSRTVLRLADMEGLGATERLVELRGRDDPVAAAAIDWVSAGAAAQSSRWSSLSHYVSRPALEEAVRGQLEVAGGVLVVGDAGSGKSRLAASVAGDSCLRASCQGLVSDVRAAVAALVRRSGGDRAHLVDRLEHAPEAEADDLLETACRLLPRDAVVVLEDAEVLSDSDVARLAAALPSASGRWVITSRRPLALPLPHIQVPPLLPAEAKAMLAGLLPGATPDLADALMRRAGDSPLFLEQCARLLLESGAVATDGTGSHVVDASALRAIPSSMRLFVSGRLDLLSGPARELVGLASVLGDAPDADLLLHLAGHDTEALQELVDRRFLQWDAGPGAPLLHFSHALVRDVAYETMLRSRRAEVHRAAAEWYAVLPVAQVLEQQAYHLEAALDPSDSDCGQVARTVEAMVLYARSIEEERTGASRDVLRRARRIVEHRAECEVDVLALEQVTASVEQLLGEEEAAERAARRALELATASGDVRAQAESLLVLGRVLTPQDHRDPGPDLDRAYDLFESVDDVTGLARVEVERGFAAQHRAGVAQHLAHLERAYSLAMRSGDNRLQAASAQQLALHHAIVNGRPSFELWAERARAASRRDDLRLAGRLALSEACLAMFGLDPGRGLEPARVAHVTGRELGHSDILRNALVARLELLVMHGELGEAEQLLAECHEAAARRPSGWLRRMFDLSEVRLRARTGDRRRALSLLEDVQQDALTENLVLRRDVAEVRGWVALESGRFEEARDHARAAVLLDQESQERVPALRARFIYLVAGSAMRQNSPLADVAALKDDARTTGLETVADLVMRWMLVEELSHGWPVDLHGLAPSSVVEARALDAEIAALSRRDWDQLLTAADTWRQLGVTIWRARALLWHTELTGAEHPETDEVLRALDAPPGIAEQLRSQVRGLRA